MAHLAQQIIDDVGRLSMDRGTWEDHWQDVADFCRPSINSIQESQTPGVKRNLELFDQTAERSLQKLAAGLFQANERLFELQAQDDRLRKVESVQRWFLEATEVLQQAMAVSNFPLVVHEDLLDYGCIGTGCVSVMPGRTTPLVYRSHHITTYFVKESDEGAIDTVYRRFSQTARQAKQRWGDALPPKIAKAADDPKQKDRSFQIIHAVFPREERDLSKTTSRNMPYASIYVSVEDRAVIGEGGFEEMPYMVHRFFKANDEVYGRSPAMTALSEVKIANKLKRITLVAGDKAIDPTLLIPDDGSVWPLVTKPGGFMYYGQGRDKPEVLQTGNPGLGLDLLQNEQQIIEKAFFVDLFATIANRDKEMTATEVLELVDERARIIGPSWSRLQTELYAPLIQRSLGILLRGGYLPPLPDELLAAPNYEIVYLSQFALAMKQRQTLAMGRTLEMLAPVAAVRPEVFDNFNFDAFAKSTAEAFGSRSDLIRPSSEVAEMRQARAQAMAEQQAKEEALAVAQAASKLQRPTAPGSPLEQLQGAVA